MDQPDLHKLIDDTLGPDSEERGLATFAELHVLAHLLADEIERLREQISTLSTKGTADNRDI